GGPTQVTALQARRAARGLRVRRARPARGLRSPRSPRATCSARVFHPSLRRCSKQRHERTEDRASFPLSRRERGPGGEDHKAGRGPGGEDRSEEHTSELQSRFDLVCRLLLEKKKRKK